MSRTEQLMYRALSERLTLIVQVEKALARVRGLGTGVWNEDAQTYINTLRQGDQL